MKLKGELDAAVWFDMLSILEVKCGRLNQNDFEKYKKVVASFDALYKTLEDQIGKEKIHTILNSWEFRELYQANLRIFDAVDLAEDITKGNDTLAYEIAQLNLLRHKWKQELQKMFFNTDTEEVKTGQYNDV